jgi:hypothetical protein
MFVDEGVRLLMILALSGIAVNVILWRSPLWGIAGACGIAAALVGVESLDTAKGILSLLVSGSCFGALIFRNERLRSQLSPPVSAPAATPAKGEESEADSEGFRPRLRKAA